MSARALGRAGSEHTSPPVRHPYEAFSAPKDRLACASWQCFTDAAKRMRAALEQFVPDGKNKDEALVRLDKAVMVAQGAFHVHPR